MKKRIFLALGLLTILIPVFTVAASSQQGSEQEYWAVVVGISDYANIEDAGPNDRDAKALYEQLSLSWGRDHVRLLVNEEATLRNIEGALTDWLASREDEEDLVFFFFAGHSCNKGRYLAPYDSLETSFARDIASATLDTWLDVLDSDQVLVLLETCHSGRMLPHLGQRGRIVITSSARDESSWGTTSGGFLFPRAVMEALAASEQGDSNGDGWLSAEEIYRYVAPKVETQAQRDLNEAQHPQISDGIPDELELIQL